MSIRCPFCGRHAGNLFALSSHIQDDHRGRELVSAISPCDAAPVFEGVDIDAVHRTFGAFSPAALASGQG